MHDRIRLALRRAGAPDDAIRAYGQERAEGHILDARKFLEHAPADVHFLSLLGSVGIGKTCAAVYVMGELLRRHLERDMPGGGTPPPPALFVRGATLGRLSAYDRADREWFDDMLRCGVLVLDDLGKEPLNEVTKSQLFELLDTRSGRSRRTVITANMGRAQFAARYGSAIADRLREHGLSSEAVGESKRTPRAEVRP